MWINPEGDRDATLWLVSVLSGIRELPDWNGSNRIFNKYLHVHMRARGTIAYFSESLKMWLPYPSEKVVSMLIIGNIK